MGLTLSVLTGLTAGRKLRLMNGQVAQFGRTEWADYAFPDDDLMGDIHFVIECHANRSQLRDLGTESGTLIGDSPVTEVQLHSGDQVTAGRTVFSVTIDGEAVPTQIKKSDTKPNPAAAVKPVPTAPSPKSLIEICQHLEFDTAVIELVTDPNMEPRAFIQFLADQRQSVPALRLRAYLLPQRDIVAWGSRCMRESMADQLTENDIAALDAADQWAKTGSEIDRRKAEAAAEATHYETAAAWIALAAFWAEGSLTDATSPPVKPDDRLTGQSITGALLMVAAKAPAGHADARYTRFLEIADEIASSESPSTGK